MQKVELHCHLDGAVNVKKASEMLGYDARERMVSQNASSLAEYLDCFATPLQLLQTADNLRLFSRLLAESLRDDEVIYAEVRFCPLLHLEQGLRPEQVVRAVLEGLREEPAVQTNVILCMMRQFDFRQNTTIINLANRFYGDGVCGLDLAGDEHAHPNCEFAELFRRVRVNGIPLTIHAGEADGPRGVDDAIDFGAKRIGHGVRAIESDATIKRLITGQIPLEICPTSNIDTGIYASLAEHPIRKLLDLGVPVTINTDNRTVSGTTLTEEYQKLRESHGFTDFDFLRCNLNAALSSFQSPVAQVQLARRLLADYAAHHPESQH